MVPEQALQEYCPAETRSLLTLRVDRTTSRDVKEAKLKGSAGTYAHALEKGFEDNSRNLVGVVEDSHVAQLPAEDESTALEDPTDGLVGVASHDTGARAGEWPFDRGLLVPNT